VFFKGNKKIKFKREHSTTKFTVLGNTFIGYHHGNCKIEDLPLIFATNKDSSVAFGNAYIDMFIQVINITIWQKK